MIGELEKGGSPTTFVRHPCGPRLATNGQFNVWAPAYFGVINCLVNA